ncbi:MAG: diguanylate cyclase [Proteobacteria bacterium]|nr:diguanylate cyclase [Pseudomonadota bacterium]
MLKESNTYKYFQKFINIITFRDIPLQKKFLLFSVGSLFWLMVVAGIGLTFMFYMDSSSKKMVDVNVPHSKTVNLVYSNVREVCVAVHKIIVSEDKALAEKNHERAISRLRESKDYLDTLLTGGKITYATRISENNTIDFLVQPVRNSEQRKIIENLKKNIDLLSSNVNEIWDLKTKNKSINNLKEKLAEYDILVLQTERNLMNLLNIMDKEWNDFSEYMSLRIKMAILLMSLILIIVIILYFIFGSLISKALKKPILEIINQIKALSTGEIDLTKKIEVSSKDELGELSREFNKLMETISHVAQFKKIAEEDDTLQDVYNRLGKIFVDELGLRDVIIYEVSNSKKNMKIVYPPELEGTEANCSMDIQLDSDLCRAKRTGHEVSSLDYPEICKFFIESDKHSHICVPMMISGNVGGVVQFVCGKNVSCDMDFKNKISRAKQYIREIQPVIETKRLTNTLKESAIRDALTGLYNRRFLEESYESIVAGIQRRGKNLGLLMCDLDFFKNINDVYGHDVGDIVLKETASVIRKNVRASDFVVRFGGEEFLVILVDIRDEEAFNVAEKIREKVEETKIKITGGVIQKTISIGVSEFPKDAQNFWQSIKYADVALYKAKERGRNRVIRFTPDMWEEEKY